MIREGHDNVKFFVGNEVEHSPAFGMRTLFVVGIQPTAHIHSWALAHNCDHIYFGANQSFPKLNMNNAIEWKPWEDMIVTMLKSGRDKDSNYVCTLDLDVCSVEALLEGPLTEFDNFIPMISVKIPYIRQLGYNATLKIDDKDFKATNPGVWCHSLHTLMKRDMVFTDWSKYTKDATIE